MTKQYLQDTFKNNTTNPKDLLGIKKDNISLVPPEGIRGIAKAMKFGADKYGAYNWRKNQVQYKIYLDAIMRHTLALIEGQDLDPDSNLSHLDHIGANVVILKDAIKYNCLVDNRDLPLNKKERKFNLETKQELYNSFNKKQEIKPLNLKDLFENKKKIVPHSTPFIQEYINKSGDEEHNTDYF